MAAATAAVIGASVAAVGLGVSIYSSQQQARMAGQAKDAARLDAASALEAANKHQASVDADNARDLQLSNQRRRQSPLSSLGGLTPNINPPSQSNPPPQAGKNPAATTQTPGSGTLLGT